MSTTNASDKGYEPGHSKEELERLERQAAFFRESTRNLLIRAGITTGMCVADYGTGAGDVAILLSELVGESGQVIAVDRAPAALEKAQARMTIKGLKNVTTLVGDENRLAEVFHANKLDAVVGRLVLPYQKDVSAAVCKLAESVRPGGIVAFQDIDVSHDLWAKPALPLMSKVWGCVVQTGMVMGASLDTCIDIVRAFKQAGIEAQHIAHEGVIESGPDAPGYTVYLELMRAALPLLHKHNVTTPEEIQLETLYDCLRDEAVACQAAFIPLYFVSAYGRVPA